MSVVEPDLYLGGFGHHSIHKQETVKEAPLRFSHRIFLISNTMLNLDPVHELKDNLPLRQRSMGTGGNLS